MPIDPDVPLRAFHADPALKAMLLARIRTDIAAGAIRDVPTGWENGAGSLAGSLLRGAPLDEAPGLLGLPASLLVIIDYLASPDIADANVTGRRFIDAIRPGTDLRSVATDWVAALIDHPVFPVHAELGSASRSASIATLRQAIAEPETAHWARDIFAEWMAFHGAKASTLSGFDEDDDARAQSMLQTLWDDSRLQRERDDSFCFADLFVAHDPAFAERYHDALAISNAAAIAARDAAIEQLVSLIEHASEAGA